PAAAGGTRGSWGRGRLCCQPRRPGRRPESCPEPGGASRLKAQENPEVQAAPEVGARTQRCRQQGKVWRTCSEAPPPPHESARRRKMGKKCLLTTNEQQDQQQ
ncbi:unnamed protein product, partial [Heterosigma akashiwo]